MDERFHPWAQSGLEGEGTGYDKLLETRHVDYWTVPK